MLGRVRRALDAPRARGRGPPRAGRGAPLAFVAAILVTGLVGVLAERVCVKPLARSSPLMTLLGDPLLGLRHPASSVR